MTLDPIPLLQQLVQINSCTPGNLRDPVPPQAATEEELALFLQQLLMDMGLETALQALAPRRPAVIAWTPPQPGRPTLAFEAHLDTVGVTGMTHPPFTAERREGRIWGRGAADTKGPMAAMLAALSQLVRQQLPVNLLFVGCAAEETGCEGAMALDLSPWKPDAVVVGEPTANQPVIGHKAHLWFELTTSGRAAHGSAPELGDNAIYRALDLVQLLRQFHAEHLAARAVPGFTPSTLAVTMIDGGVKVNIIPERCRLRADLRLVPGFDEKQVLADIVAAARAQCGSQVALTWKTGAPAFSARPGSALLAAFSAGMRACHLDAKPATVNYCTDAGPLSQKGYDCLVFGPGSIKQAHGAEEYIEVAEVEAAVGILCATATAYAAG